jgi:hypothetical protein
MSSFTKVEFNKNYITKMIYDRAIGKVYDCNGIIFGGAVRDKVIANHYTEVYNAESNDIYDTKRFWNKQVHPETAHRMLVPKDLDICVETEAVAKTLAYEIKNLITSDFGVSNVKAVFKYSKTPEKYFNFPIASLTKLSYEVRVGAIPYITNGIVLSLNFDIVVPHNRNIQPPFKKLDMLCNAFVMSRHGGITLSRHTGTAIDRMGLIERKKMEVKILSDIIEFKTDFCLDYGKYTKESVNYFKVVQFNTDVFSRVENMALKEQPWIIRNLPFDMEIESKGCTETCCICMSGFKKMSGKVSVSIQGSDKKAKIKGGYIHNACLFKYMRNQLEEEKNMANALMSINQSLDEFTNREFCFKCPMRNRIDFVEGIASIYGATAVTAVTAVTTSD